ncbi:MAG TPA: Ig-like domain-containing protein [Brevibacillus sp.]|nr:Ig-like domain-containing protein [Brevibacillus sp.]
MGTWSRKWLHAACVVVLLLFSFCNPEYAQGKSPQQWNVSILPANGEKEVAADTLIVLKFSEQILLKGKKALTDKSVHTLVQLRDQKNKNVKFTAKWDKNNRTILVDPEGNLEEGQSYTITLLDKKLVNAAGVLNPKVTHSFTTKKAVDRIAPQAVILPGHGAKKVNVKEKITLQFVEDVRLAIGEALVSKNAGSLVRITDGKGQSVAYTATWNKSKRTLTVKPKGGKWLPNTTYRIYLIPGKVKDMADNRNSAQSSQFSTGSK